MKLRLLCLTLLLCLLMPSLISCADAPYTIAQARAKADDIVERWNRDDVRYCNFFYVTEYLASEKTYRISMHPLTSSEMVMTRMIVQETVEKIYAELHDKCFANRPDVSIEICVYSTRGECRYIYDGKTLKNA